MKSKVENRLNAHAKRFDTPRFKMTAFVDNWQVIEGVDLRQHDTLTKYFSLVKQITTRNY